MPLSWVNKTFVNVPPLKGTNLILQKLRVPGRFRSAIIDRFGMILIIILVGFPALVVDVFQTIKEGKPPDTENQLWFIIYACFLYSLYVNKDVFSAQSIGKQICLLQVINRKTNQPAGPLRCLLRNLTIIIWPIELIVLLITQRRRLGDVIANTTVREVSNSPKNTSLAQVIASFIVGALVYFIIVKFDLTPRF